MQQRVAETLINPLENEEFGPLFGNCPQNDQKSITWRRFSPRVPEASQNLIKPVEY